MAIEECKMGKQFINLLMFLCWLEHVRAGKYLTVDSSICSDFYYIEDIDYAYLTYDGAALEECYVKFILHDSFQQTQCIEVIEEQLSCSTTVEVYRHFISEYLTPKKVYSCREKSSEDWCGAARTANLFVVFKKKGGSSNDRIKLKVYRKPLNEDNKPSYSDSSSSTAVAVVIPVVVSIVIIIVIVAVVVAMRKRQNSPLYLGQTYTTQTHVHAQQPIYQQQHGQPQQPPPISGNYHIHPMQTAYPATASQAATPLIYNQQQPLPSAPEEDTMAPPPSYDSVMQQS